MPTAAGDGIVSQQLQLFCGYRRDFGGVVERQGIFSVLCSLRWLRSGASSPDAFLAFGLGQRTEGLKAGNLGDQETTLVSEPSMKKQCLQAQVIRT